MLARPHAFSADRGGQASLDATVEIETPDVVGANSWAHTIEEYPSGVPGETNALVFTCRAHASEAFTAAIKPGETHDVMLEPVQLTFWIWFTVVGGLLFGILAVAVVHRGRRAAAA